MKKTISQKHAHFKNEISQVQEQFTGKNMTRFGGSGLIRRFFQKHDVEDVFSKRIVIKNRRKSKYSVAKILISCLYGIFIGYPRPSHMQTLKSDRVFQKLVGLFDFPVQSTISRFLSGLKVSVARQIGSINFDLMMKFRKGFKGFKVITLDLDSHVMTVYGNQQRSGRGYNPKKKGRKSYHPLLCFIGESRDYLGGILRSGKHHTSYHAVEFLKKMMKKLPEHIDKVRFRADSGFFNGDLIKYLLKNHIEFYIAVPMQPWVQKKIKHLRQWKSIGYGIDTGECEYVFEKEAGLRMVIVRQKVKAGKSPKKQLKLLHGEDVIYDYQVILSDSVDEGEEVWRCYNKRACCENFIKEGIYGFGLDKIVSHRYAGNYAWFELLMLTYNLMNMFKEEVLNQKNEKQTIQTIRDRIFFIPGKLITRSRRRILKLERTWMYQNEYKAALARIT